MTLRDQGILFSLYVQRIERLTGFDFVPKERSSRVTSLRRFGICSCAGILRRAVPVTGSAASAILEDSLSTKKNVPVQRYVQRFAHNVTLSERPHWSNKSRGGRTLPITERGDELWRHRIEETVTLPPPKRRREEPQNTEDAGDQVYDGVLQALRDDLIIDHDALVQERGGTHDDLDDDDGWIDEEEPDWLRNEYERNDHENDPLLEAAPEPAGDESTPSAVLLGFAEGELDIYPTLSDQTADHPWVIGPRSTSRPPKMLNPVKVRARRCYASTLGPGRWSLEFSDEPKYTEANEVSVEEIRAELRRRLDRGPEDETRRVRRRRWYVPPGRPPD